MSSPVVSPTLSLSEACEAVNTILAEFDRDIVAERLEQAREEADGDLNEIMVKVVPLIFEVQGNVMSKYHFEGTDEGFAAFADQLKQYEVNNEFNELATKLKNKMKELTTIEQRDDEEEDDEDDDENSMYDDETSEA